ncbi:MAG: hypothetical protein ABI437_12135, partial [Kofleriaceae bacterium]
MVNLTGVERAIHSIRVGHLPLALAANTLARREEDLKSYIDDGFPQETSSYGANVRLRTARSPRDAAFKALGHTVDNLRGNDIPIDAGTTERIAEMSALLDGMKAPYEQLSIALRKGEALDADTVTAPVRAIHDGERKFSQQTVALSSALQNVVTDRTKSLEEAQHFVRFVAIGLGVI